MTLKVHGQRIASAIQAKAAPQSSPPVASIARSLDAPSGAEEGSLAMQVERAGRFGHDFSRLKVQSRGLAPIASEVPAGAGSAGRQAIVGGGGVIQCHGKRGGRKKGLTDRQKEAGLNVSKAFDLYDIGVGRIPHNAGGIAAGGSGRAETHAHGNQVAISAAATNAVESGLVESRQDPQSSVVRSKIAGQEREERLQEKELEKETGGIVTEKDEAREKFNPKNAQKGRQRAKKKEEAEAADEQRERERIAASMQSKPKSEEEIAEEQKAKAAAEAEKAQHDRAYFNFTDKGVDLPGYYQGLPDPGGRRRQAAEKKAKQRRKKKGSDSEDESD